MIRAIVLELPKADSTISQIQADPKADNPAATVRMVTAQRRLVSTLLFWGSFSIGFLNGDTSRFLDLFQFACQPRFDGGLRPSHNL